MNAELVAGRRALLEALRALAPHTEALILVGAHAVQEWAGPVDAGIGGSPMSMDADLQVDTLALGSDPTLEEAMRGAGFQLARTQGAAQPGIWLSNAGVQVDLLVAEAQARGPGSRAAGLDARDRLSARRVEGLEACLHLNVVRPIGALDEADVAPIKIRVARPAALLVAKAHKLGERVAAGGRRARGKDALDVLRLLLAEEGATTSREMGLLLRNPACSTVARAGVKYVRTLFGAPNAPGCGLLRDEYPQQGATFAAQVQELAAELLSSPEVA